MFAILPGYIGTTSKDIIINLDNIDDIAPHDPVPVDPVEGDQHLTDCCEATLSSGIAVIILLDINTVATRLQALTGVISQFGELN